MRSAGKRSKRLELEPTVSLPREEAEVPDDDDGEEEEDVDHKRRQRQTRNRLKLVQSKPTPHEIENLADIIEDFKMVNYNWKG